MIKVSTQDKNIHLELNKFEQRVVYQIQNEYSSKDAYHGLKSIIKWGNTIKNNQASKNRLVFGIYNKKTENVSQKGYLKNIKQS